MVRTQSSLLIKFGDNSLQQARQLCPAVQTLKYDFELYVSLTIYLAPNS